MFNSVLIVGCGGIGQHLIPPLVKLLQYHPKGTLDITIADGDHFELLNSSRQYVTQVGLNKAVSLKHTLPNHVKALPIYVDRTNVHSLLVNLVEPCLVIPSVDNMATRHILLKTLDQIKKDYLWICPGNGYSTYQVSVYSKGLFSHPFDRYVNLKYPDDNLPNSCIQEQTSTPQLIAANFGAAFATINLITNLLESRSIPQELVGDLWLTKYAPVGLCKDYLRQ